MMRVPFLARRGVGVLPFADVSLTRYLPLPEFTGYQARASI
jgi:hypothetical protein